MATVSPSPSAEDATRSLSGDIVAPVPLSLDDAKQRGNSLWARYRKEGAADLAVLDAAIQATQSAVTLSSDMIDPELLGDLGLRLFARFMLRFDLNDLNNLVSMFERAVELTSDDDPSLPKRISRLGTSRIERFHHSGGRSDLDSAITSFCCAIELLHEDDADRPIHLSNYGASLLERFEQFGELEDLESALSAQCRAIELTPNGREDKPMQYSNLGNAFLMRFGRVGEVEDLQKGITAHRSAVELTLDGHPEKSPRLSNLGNSLLTHFARTGDLDALEQAISAHGLAVDITADSHPDKPTRLNNLGSSLVARFGRTGELDVLERAISIHSRAVELSSDDHPDNAMRWTNLGSSLLTRFQRLGRLEDLEQAIFAHAHAVELTPDGHFDKLSRLNNLGASFLTRFKRVGELDDVQRAIAVHHHAIATIPEGHPKKPWWYNNLGDALFMRFERTGEIEDLDRAIASHRCAIELTPDDHPDKSSLVNSLGIALLRRFERFGILQDLDSSILLRQHALKLTPADHPSTPLRLYEFGNSVLTRFERTGELDFLERAISAYRHAIELTPEGHTDKPSMFDSLGRSLAGRYGRTGEFEDLESSISLHRRAIELSPDGHPDKPLRIDHLATSLSGRFERTGELEDLDGAIEAYRSALERTPDGHAYKPMRMGNLCGGLCMRFEHYKDLDDLESALLLGHSSIDLIPEGHPELAGRYNTLAVCYQRRFELMGHSEDLASAVSMFQKAIELTPDGHPGLSLWFANLAGVLGQLFVHSQTQLNFDSAIQSFMASIRQPLGTPSIRLQSARRCLHMLLAYPGFSSVESLHLTYSSIIAVLPEIVWLGYSIHRRFDESESLGVLVTAAVSSAIEAGSLNQAVEWFEAGRTLIWSQLLALRMPLDELQEKQPNLADSLRSVQQQLQQSAPNSFVSESTTLGGIPGVTSNTAADRHRQLVIKYDSILKEIRSCVGFEDFLRPKRLGALIPSRELLDGPVVFVNVHPIRRDAVILSPDGNITSIPLADLSFERAVELRRLWVNDVIGGRARARGLGSIGDFEGELNPLKTYLGHMWNWIVRPVLETLDLASLVKGDRLPHITWCPTGPLMQLPLHAAGLYDEPHGPRVFDFVVSSYTPSLSALLRGYRSTEEPLAMQDVLIVTQPDTPNHMPLPGTVHEGTRLKSTLDASGITSKWLNDEVATVKEVLEVMNRYPWVHLACHGSQNQQDATRSAFELFDGPLTLSDLMGTAAENAELAFLSACQTAVGDEKTPEESAHLAAGMLAVGFKGVIATMWSIQDADAPIVVDAFYKEMLVLRSAGAFGKGSTGAAYALHEATRVLREELGENSFLRWVPFVHFGV